MTKIYLIIKISFRINNSINIPNEYVVPEDKCPLFLTPDIYLKIYWENLKTPHRWKSIAQRIGIMNVDNIIIKNKAIEIERKIKDYKKHHNIIQNIPFELESIIEYLREEEEIFEEEDQENEDNIYEYEEEEIYEFEEEEEEEEEFEEDDENGTDDETMNPY
ncbi:hypothetical protein M9Y10_005943 [Tritrichomonas musculus]|uniref:Uncharacterized protein n=1 Tax=Tritrichomonas musculus TaxID=1915356 RepID=A0ABR2JEJ3_9EUKA